MFAKSRELGTATLVGLVAGGLASVFLSMIDSFLIAVGAFIGGVVAAYVLYGKISQGAIAGALSGVLSTLFFLGFSQILIIFELIPLPSGQPPPMSELQASVVAIVLMNLVAGGVGGSLLAVVRHPSKVLPAPPPPPGYSPGQVRYCVQCGAQLPGGTLICPHCNARQPQ